MSFDEFSSHEVHVLHQEGKCHTKIILKISHTKQSISYQKGEELAAIKMQAIALGTYNPTIPRLHTGIGILEGGGGGGEPVKEPSAACSAMLLSHIPTVAQKGHNEAP